MGYESSSFSRDSSGMPLALFYLAKVYVPLMGGMCSRAAPLATSGSRLVSHKERKLKRDTALSESEAEPVESIMGGRLPGFVNTPGLLSIAALGSIGKLQGEWRGQDRHSQCRYRK